MRVIVDFDLCERNAICMQIAPNVVEVRGDAVQDVLEENPGEDDRSTLQEAVQRCPKQAISLED